MLEKPVYPPLLVIRKVSQVVFTTYDMDGSDNVRGAENQQERLWTSGWVIGVVDGGGCFGRQIHCSSSEVLRILRDHTPTNFRGL